MKTLKLTLMKKWFDLIADGHKTVEYREVKKHWTQRLALKRQARAEAEDMARELRKFDEVHFTNGYGSQVPFLRVECKGVNVIVGAADGHLSPRNQEPLVPGKLYYAIELGAVLEARR